jgi:hypothetical protein
MDDAPKDPSDQSGRPWMVSGAVALIIGVLVILLVVGLVVLT